MRDQAFGLRELVKRTNLKRDRAAKSRRPSKQIVYAVASGKGGVGKTNVAVNLGIAMARCGSSVLILDADLGMANVNVVLGENVTKTLYNVFRGEKRLDEIIYPSRFGVDFISGGSGMHELANLSGAERYRFIEQMKHLQRYDVVLVDVGAGINSTVTTFLRAVDIVLIVTTPEPTAITDAYAVMKAMLNAGADGELRLIVNQCQSEAQGEQVSARIKTIVSRFLDREIVYSGCVLSDKTVRKAVYKQTPYIVYEPRAVCSQNIKKITGKLTGSNFIECNFNGLSGFFKKIFTMGN